jgi:hypothetical protein
MMPHHLAHRSRVAFAMVIAAVSPISACAQQTDTTIAVKPDARVQIQNFAGTIRVITWERNAVRVHAGQSRRDEVRIQGDDAALSVATVSKSGVPGPIDYEITVPARASLDISGTYTDVTIEGVRASVSATTVQGAVTLRGGDGVISLKSVEGAISVQDATGRVEVNGVNKGLVLRNVNGDIAAETVNGSIELEGIESSDVDAETVNGRVTYAGSIRDRGRYRFGSHNGNITISIPERSNATVAAVSYQGSISSRFELPKAVSDGIARSPRRADFALGNGSGRIEAESFQGDVVFVRPGDPAIRPR